MAIPRRGGRLLPRGCVARLSEASTLIEALATRSAETPSASFASFATSDGAVVDRSYEEMHSRALRAASALRTLGVERGERVNVHLSNHPAFFDVWFGCAALGAVLVPTNPLLTASELAFELEHCGAVLSITSEEAGETVARSTDALTTGAFAEALNDATEYDGPAPDALDPAAILYTSGTTSRPKGVVVTHANYLHAGRVVADHLEITPEDRWLVVLPLFHANAQYYSTMSALVSGASLAVMDRFSASRWGSQAREHNATLASLFAAPIRMILAAESLLGEENNDLRAAIFSQNVTESQLSEFESRFGVPLHQLYGMTETIAPPTMVPMGDDRRNMSIGRPTEGSQVRLVSDGEDVQTGEVGEIWVAGEPGVTVMAGYLDDPEATAEALADGWLRTGDLARSDEDGFLYFVDRAKDMIKRAGENVSAGEVEAVVDAHPAVLESAAVGIPDPIRDEAIRLFCVLLPGREATEADILDLCRERLAPFKVPSEVVFVPALPRTSVGKVQKEELRLRDGGQAS